MTNKGEKNNHLEDEIDKLRQTIKTKGDFARLLELLYEDYRQNKNEWENSSLDHYLEAMSAWLYDSGAYYASRGEKSNLDQPSWRILADILLAARVYE